MIFKAAKTSTTTLIMTSTTTSKTNSVTTSSTTLMMTSMTTLMTTTTMTYFCLVKMDLLSLFVLPNIMENHFLIPQICELKNVALHCGTFLETRKLKQENIKIIDIRGTISHIFRFLKSYIMGK